MAERKIGDMQKYAVIGITNAGKSTLLNKLIGHKILISNEMRATAHRWIVKFHDEKSFKLEVYKNVNQDVKLDNSQTFEEAKELSSHC
jgi:tRNA U34 5-carboxymethylaminomethyl modifying GTPase MnmE/TrmE